MNPPITRSARDHSGPAAATTAPYRVHQLDTSAGPRWRLSGPGLGDVKAYPWQEFRDKLDELAEVMNFAWQQGRASRRDDPAPAPRA